MKKKYNNKAAKEAVKKDIDKVVGLACKLGDITQEELFSPSRKRLIGDVRICTANILRRIFGLTQQETGEYLNRDHASVVHYEKQHEWMMKLHYYKKMYDPCVKMARDVSFNSDEVLAEHYETLSKLKTENVLLQGEIKELKVKLKKFEKLNQFMKML